MRHSSEWRRLLRLAGLGVISLSLAACGSDSKYDADAGTPASGASGTVAAGGQQPITVTDIVGRQVTVKAPVKSMILSEGRAL